MAERICYFNGEYVPESEARVHISDFGLWEGAIYEVGRTYDRKPFKLKEHVDRFFYAIRCLPFIKFNLSPQEVIDITLEVLGRNDKCLDPGDDWRFIYKLTRGIQFAASDGPTFYIHLVPMGSPFGAGYQQIVKWYQEGAHLVVVNTRQIPPQCLDPKIKHTNRLCNRLAEYEARMVDPDAFALMLDINGYAAESPISNFFIVRDGNLLTSRLVNCLSGITRKTVLELAEELKIECTETDLCVPDVYNADEIIITGTSFAIIPVSKFNNIPLTVPIPGPITRRLQIAFGDKINFDIVQRALDFVNSKGVDRQ